MKTNKYQECIWIFNNSNMEICVDRFRITYNGKWRALGFCLALYGKIGCCDSTSIDGFEMILYCRFWLLIESLVEYWSIVYYNYSYCCCYFSSLSPLPFTHWFQTIKIDNHIPCQQKKWNQWKQRIKQFLFSNQWSIRLWMFEC